MNEPYQAHLGSCLLPGHFPWPPFSFLHDYVDFIELDFSIMGVVFGAEFFFLADLLLDLDTSYAHQ